MTATVRWLRRQLAGIVALVLMAVLFLLGQVPTPSAAEAEHLAGQYRFDPKSIAMPSGFPQQQIREVNQEYKHIDAWISAVGAGIAMEDLDGDGLSNDLCITEPRIDRVVVTPTPGAGSGRYAPFALDPGRLPMNDTMAPMGCAPGDFNEDGRMDLLVYYWGRTPIIYLARPGASGLAQAAFRPVELVPGVGSTTYTGPQWNSNAVAIADFDGDGHDDIYLGNYFPHSPLLDETVDGGVAMNRSLSNAANGGEDYIFRWTGASTGPDSTVTYEKLDDVLATDTSKGWVLASGANDLDGDLLPELYIAQDHGPDALLHNRSTPGNIEFAPVQGKRYPMVPKSKRVGVDSFKGMGVDFGDLNGDGLYDMFVSNITTSWGIQESNYHFLATASDQSELRDGLNNGVAPYADRSAQRRTAWGGWCWDVKLGDFDNSGNPEIVQTNGFIEGDINRWPQLQELAVANDTLVEHPDAWPRVSRGDDISGDQRLNFFSKTDSGRYANLSDDLGLDVPVPTRGIATGDADGDGRLDFAVARQWDSPVFYQNESPSSQAFLGLRLTHATDPVPGDLPAPGSPVVGAQVRVTTSDGSTQIARVDGGSGHSGKRSQSVHVGLGDVTGPVQVELQWRDRTGQVRQQQLELTPGWHELQLGAQVKEK